MTGNKHEGLGNNTHADYLRILTEYLRVLHTCIGLLTHTFTFAHSSVVAVTPLCQVHAGVTSHLSSTVIRIVTDSVLDERTLQYT